MIFNDINPVSKTAHLQCVPYRHISHWELLKPDDIPLIKHIQETAKTYMTEHYPDAEVRYGFHNPGRVSVQHLHMHCIVLPIEPEWKEGRFSGVNLRSAKFILES